MLIDESMASHVLQTYDPDDWIAIFVKSYASGRIGQRVLPVRLATTRRIQEWLHRENEAGMNLYLSINAVAPKQTSRQRAAIRTVRHVFVDVDQRGEAVLEAISRRHDLPRPSYVLHTSRQRVHVLWRVTGFSPDTSEVLQRHLARELHADMAATSCAQLTRLPGFLNHKYAKPWLVALDHCHAHHVYEPEDFPRPAASPSCRAVIVPRLRADRVERARRYVAAVPPAIAGQHGDTLTFQICCRLVRGFALSNAEAVDVLREWNAHCLPPWTDRELFAKLNSARKYGREPVGGLLEEAVSGRAEHFKQVP
jgi:hypothetical protein